MRTPWDDLKEALDQPRQTPEERVEDDCAEVLELYRMMTPSQRKKWLAELARLCEVERLKRH